MCLNHKIIAIVFMIYSFRLLGFLEGLLLRFFFSLKHMLIRVSELVRLG